MASDRPDIAYSAKELCHEIAVPNVRSYAKLKRLVRYLAMNPRLTYHFDFQDQPVGLKVYVDTNLAGCKATRRSTSGGAAMFGSHLLKHLSKTQTTVCLSSGEAELVAAVKNMHGTNWDITTNEGLRNGGGRRSLR